MYFEKIWFGVIGIINNIIEASPNYDMKNFCFRTKLFIVTQILKILFQSITKS